MEGYERYYLVKYKRGNYIQPIAMCQNIEEAKELCNYFNDIKKEGDYNNEWYYYDNLFVSKKVIKGLFKGLTNEQN